MMKTINQINILAGFVFLLLSPFKGLSQNVYGQFKLQHQLDQARADVYNEKFDDAIPTYAELVKENANPTVSAEYAYALALSGCFEGAVMTFDRLIENNQIDNGVLFYISQVFKLMDYSEIGDLFWTFNINDQNSYAPGWISGKYTSMVEEHKTQATINIDDYGTALHRANKLAEQQQYIQALVLFLELTETYPDAYLPQIGLSALLENLGYKKEAAKHLLKGIEKMGEEKATIDPSGIYEKHLENLSTNSSNNSTIFKPGAPNTAKKKDSRLFGTIGISYFGKTLGLNVKIGHYSSETTFFSLGYSGSLVFLETKVKTHTIDLSFNNTWGVFMLGLSASVQWINGELGVGVGPSLGFAIPLPSGKSSIDIYGTGHVSIQDGMAFKASASIGYTRYF